MIYIMIADNTVPVINNKIIKGGIYIEEWREIHGYEGYYEVSNMGNVRTMNRIIYKSDGSYQTYKSKPIKISYNKRNNMYVVYLSINGKRTCKSVHRLVAKEFCYNDDPENKVTVNHIDGDRSNNKAENLEWTTYSENLQHAYDLLNRPHNKASKKCRQCISFNKFTNEEINHKSVAAASRYTNISETQIRRIAKGECINNTYNFIIK